MTDDSDWRFYRTENREEKNRGIGNRRNFLAADTQLCKGFVCSFVDRNAWIVKHKIDIYDRTKSSNLNSTTQFDFEP